MENAMKPSKQSLLTASILSLALTAPAFAQHVDHVAAKAPVAAKVAETGAALRDLWAGHIF
jgi:hypothetical protein